MRPNPVVQCRDLLRRFARSQRGVISVEFALAAPVLVAVAIAGFDLGRGFQQKHLLSGAAQAGAQLAVQRDRSFGLLSIADVEQRVRDDAGSNQATLTVNARYYCACPGTNVEVACDATCAAPRPPSTYVEVALQKDFDLILKYPGLSDPCTLRAMSTMRVR